MSEFLDRLAPHSAFLLLAVALAACGERERDVDVAETAAQRSDPESRFESHGDAGPDPGARPAATAEPLTEAGAAAEEAEQGPATEGQVLALMRAIHTSEIEAGRAELELGDLPEVQALGRRLVTDHQAMLRRLAAVVGGDVRPESNALSRAVSVQADSILAALRADPRASNVDRAYVTAQVDAHREGLAAVDRMLRRVEDSRLEGVLQDSRATMAEHLRDAEQLMTAVWRPDSLPPDVDPPLESDTGRSSRAGPRHPPQSS